MITQAYLLQSPYSQPFQVGRPDPAQKAETAKAQNDMFESVKPVQKQVNSEIIPMTGNSFSIEMGSLKQIGSSAGLQETQTMSRLAQARNAYSEN